MSTFIELGRIQAIEQLFEGTPYRPFGEPLRFCPKAKDSVAGAVKTLTEGIDFDLKYFPLKHLGYKGVLALTGELYSCLAKPRTLSVTIGVSAKLDFPQVQQVWQGIVAAAKEFAYADLSLELKPSATGLLLSFAATGELSYLSAARKPKAKSKDLLCVSGSLGAAYFGEQVLLKKFGEIEKYKMLVGSYIRPELPAGIPERLEEAEIYPSAGVFVNAGLSDAVMRICRETGLGAKVYADKIPFEGNSFALGKELDIDPVSAAMNGGEDCRLLFAVPILQLEKFRRDFQTFDIIGHLSLPEVGSVVVTPDGVELPLKAQGYAPAEEDQSL